MENNETTVWLKLVHGTVEGVDDPPPDGSESLCLKIVSDGGKYRIYEVREVSYESEGKILRSTQFLVEGSI